MYMIGLLTIQFHIKMLEILMKILVWSECLAYHRTLQKSIKLLLYKEDCPNEDYVLLIFKYYNKYPASGYNLAVIWHKIRLLCKIRFVVNRKTIMDILDLIKIISIYKIFIRNGD